MLGMDMWSSVRFALLLPSSIALLWSLTVLPTFRSATPVRELTERVLADQRFKPAALVEALARIEREPSRLVVATSVVRAAALVGLRVAEGAIDRTSPEMADREVAAAEQRVRAALSLNPTDAFLWLMLYSVAAERNGFDIGLIKYLDQSYATGPYEGLIALRRNRLTLAVFSMLGPATRERAGSEFAGLVDSGFSEDAALILTSVGWVNREQLLPLLERTDIASREALARQLSRRGFSVEIPGVKQSDRPWG